MSDDLKKRYMMIESCNLNGWQINKETRHIDQHHYAPANFVK